MSCACVVLPNLSLSSDRQGIRLFPVDMYYPASPDGGIYFLQLLRVPPCLYGLGRSPVFTSQITYCSPLSHVNVYSGQECVYLRGCRVFRHA